MKYNKFYHIKYKKFNDIVNNNFHKNNNEQRLLLGSGPIGNSLLNQNSKPKLTLDQCFESYLKPEYFSGNNKQHCNKCHTLTEAYYTTYIIHQVIF